MEQQEKSLKSDSKREVFLGRLGRDPEMKRSEKNIPICNMSVAINSEGGDEPIWKNVVVWGEQAIKCGKHLKKGGQVFVHGQNFDKEYTSKSGEVKRYKEVNARLVGFTNI